LPTGSCAFANSVSWSSSSSFARSSPRFLDGPNLEQVALSATLVCIVALGQALVIIARQIDLSVGAIVAMSAFVTASWLEGRPDGGILTAFLIGCGVGAALGTGNALLVAVARIPAVVATLGTLAIYRGAAIVIARGRQISATVLPESYQEVAQLHIAGVPLLVWLALLLTLFFSWMARYTRLGRNLYALGSSPQSARVAGISETRGIAFVFILSGLLCGFVGVLWGARFGTVDAVIARGLNLEVISAVVVGGVSIFGGSGSRRRHLRGPPERRSAPANQPVLARCGRRDGDPRYRRVLHASGEEGRTGRA